MADPVGTHFYHLGTYHAHGHHCSVSTCDSLAEVWLWLQVWAQPAYGGEGGRNAGTSQPPIQSRPVTGKTPASSLLEVPRGTETQLPSAVPCPSMHPELAPLFPCLGNCLIFVVLNVFHSRHSTFLIRK